MTTYIYKAKKSTAETVTGKISAHSQDEAIDLINQLGFSPVSVVEESEREGAKSIDVGKPRKIKIKELHVFSRQLANLLKSGVSLLRALGIIEEQTQNPYFKKVISQVAWDIKNGKSFSDSLAVYPHIFSSLFITMVNAGEESGNLYAMLVNISTYQRRQEEILSKVRTALAYPGLMAVMGVASVYFILTFVLPKMTSLFDSIGDAMPLPTVILLNVSEVLSKGGVWIIIGVLGIAYSISRWSQSKKGRVVMSRFLLSLPLFGEVILKTELARFCRTLVLLSKSGVSILKSLQISIPILSNELIKGHLMRCKDDLEGGGSFGESIKNSKEIPSMMGHLIAVGEESGNLEGVLEEIADSYEQETDETIKIMTTLLEPIMILVVGLVIGFIVFAMLLPIFQVDILAG